MAPVLIRQFDVFRNVGRSGKAYPLIVVLQSDLVDDGPWVVATALVPPARVPPSKVTPAVQFGEGRWILMIPDLGPVLRSMLRARVGTVEHERRRIIGAIDYLFTGV